MHICCMNNPRQTVKGYAETLFSTNTSPLQKRDSVQALHQLFVSLGAINALEAPDSLPDHLQLPSGRAIAPRQAGLCLLESMRTRAFAEGLREAIGDLLRQFPGKTIQVLDAGCGPYALLPLLAALFYTPQQVQFTILDIFEQNLASARILIRELGMADYFSSYVRADATMYRWPGSEGPDIIISETMNKGLEKEPQVAITLNLAAQLPPHGLLLPEMVAVSLKKINTSLQQKALCNIGGELPKYSLFEQDLGLVLTLDKHATMAAVTACPLCSVAIPAEYDEHVHKLQLCTVINVYQEQFLQRADCSLTIPLNIEPFGKLTVKAGDVLDFYYMLHPVPGIGFKKQVAATAQG